ncbi:MAG: tRNA 5-methoxyuridine(34)/uridine 5-oxyacetic acid(34) synthase CmoB [Proteobacteria bacterium]|nr:tRNA 5-methoxyuridine(34)/uridine 5-oxyacetic acid(34) synthase CmoB [Pseudomonadota bacterium]
MDYLDYLPASADTDAIVKERCKRLAWANQDKKGFLRYRTPAMQLTQYQAAHVDCSGDTVIIGDSEEISDLDRHIIRNHLKAFMPWRKGPFSVFGIDIDAEWRSEKKWQRVSPALPDLSGKIIADIGCNNGYYMFRMAPALPELVLGFEPSIQHYYCFKALHGMAGCPGLDIDLLGVEHLSLFKSCFDVVFLMGVIYHRPSPVDTLRDILCALKPDGTLIVESQAIPGDDPMALFPTDTYAKVPGTYFVPTGACLCNWMKKAGFIDISLFCRHPMSGAEQRRTDWMVFESYDDFIAPENPGLTVEGYPAPWRIFVKGRKKA